MKVIDYKIIKGRDFEVEQQVNELLALGWEMSGNPFYYMLSGDVLIVVQAMINNLPTEIPHPGERTRTDLIGA